MESNAYEITSVLGKKWQDKRNSYREKVYFTLSMVGLGIDDCNTSLREFIIDSSLPTKAKTNLLLIVDRIDVCQNELDKISQIFPNIC